MDRFIVGNYYILRNSRRLDIGTYLCTRRTDSFIFFQKENSWKEIRRKCQRSYDCEYVEFDKGHPSSIRGAWTGRKIIMADDRRR